MAQSARRVSGSVPSSPLAPSSASSVKGKDTVIDNTFFSRIASSATELAKQTLSAPVSDAGRVIATAASGPSGKQASHASSSSHFRLREAGPTATIGNGGLSDSFRLVEDTGLIISERKSALNYQKTSSGLADNEVFALQNQSGHVLDHDTGALARQLGQNLDVAPLVQDNTVYDSATVFKDVVTSLPVLAGHRQLEPVLRIRTPPPVRGPGVGYLQQTYSPEFNPQAWAEEMQWKRMWEIHVQRSTESVELEDGAAVRGLLSLPSSGLQPVPFALESKEVNAGSGSDSDVFGSKADNLREFSTFQLDENGDEDVYSEVMEPDSDGTEDLSFKWNKAMSKYAQRVWNDHEHYQKSSQQRRESFNIYGGNQLSSLEQRVNETLLSGTETGKIDARKDTTSSQNTGRVTTDSDAAGVATTKKHALTRLRMVLGHLAQDSRVGTKQAGYKHNEGEDNFLPESEFLCPWYSCHERFNNLLDLELHRSVHPAGLPCVHEACAHTFDSVPCWEAHINERHHDILKSQDSGITAGDD